MEHYYKTVEGFFNYENVYKKVIDESPDNSHFVEIGVWKGKSVCYAAVEIENSGKKIRLDAVDHFLGSEGESKAITEDKDLKNNNLYNIFLQNIDPVKHIVNPVKMSSEEASKLYEDSSLDFVFIDGMHSYEACYSDIKNWLPKIKNGGYIGGHDIDGPEKFNGVRKAVEQFFQPQKVQIFNRGWASWLVRKE